MPTFLFVGAERAGTTWFYARLKEHPDIFMPNTKELHFFNKFNTNLEELDRFEELGFEYYTRFFRRHDGEKEIGEVCPMYLCDPYAPARIKQVLPEVKVIACLRNPVDRAYSQYWMARWKGWVDLSFDEVVRRKESRFVERGQYYGQIKNYSDLFPSGNILTLIYEEVFDDPILALRTIAAFLNVDPDFFSNEEKLRQRENRASGYRSPFLHNLILKVARFMRTHSVLSVGVDFAKDIGLARWIKEINEQEKCYPPMQASHRQDLIRYYNQDIEKLEQLTGYNLSAWK